MPTKRGPVDEPKEPDTHVTTIRLPDPWYEDLRERAHRERRAINDLIKEALRDKYGYTLGLT